FATDGKRRRPDVDGPSAHQGVVRLSRPLHGVRLLPLRPLPRRRLEKHADGPVPPPARQAGAGPPGRHGQRRPAQYLLGEVDVFKVEPDYELYGHLNINYLKLDKLP